MLKQKHEVQCGPDNDENGGCHNGESPDGHDENEGNIHHEGGGSFDEDFEREELDQEEASLAAEQFSSQKEFLNTTMRLRIRSKPASAVIILVH